MKIIKVLSYRGCPVKIFNNGMSDGSFPYEYRFKHNGEWISDRTSHNSVESCIRLCKQDIDCEVGNE